MKRRDFFNWIGKISAVLGLGYLSGRAEGFSSLAPGNITSDISSIKESGMRMSGRACHDWRMISTDRSMMLDKDVFYS